MITNYRRILIKSANEPASINWPSRRHTMLSLRHQIIFKPSSGTTIALTIRFQLKTRIQRRIIKNDHYMAINFFLETTKHNEITTVESSTNPRLTMSGIKYGVCGEFVFVGVSCSLFPLQNQIPTHEKVCLLCGKKWPQMPFFNLIFLGLGWPWVREFVGFIVMFTGMCFPIRSKSQTP